MYQISPTEVQTLLQKLRIIRQVSGEAIAFLEHLEQLQGSKDSNKLCYDPDDYLSRYANGFEKQENI